MRSQNPSDISSDKLNRRFKVKLQNLELRKLSLPPLILSKRVTAVRSVPSAVADGGSLAKDVIHGLRRSTANNVDRRGAFPIRHTVPDACWPLG